MSPEQPTFNQISEQYDRDHKNATVLVKRSDGTISTGNYSGARSNEGTYRVDVTTSDGKEGHKELSAEALSDSKQAELAQELAETRESLVPQEEREELGTLALDAVNVEAPEASQISEPQANDDMERVKTARKLLAKLNSDKNSGLLEDKLGALPEGSLPRVEAEKTEIDQKLEINAQELDLIGQLVNNIANHNHQLEGAPLAPGEKAGSINQYVSANHQGVMNAIEQGGGEKLTAQVLASLAAAGALEDGPYSSHLINNACDQLAKMSSPEDASNLSRELYQALDMKLRQDATEEEKTHENYRRFNNLAQDSYLNDKPKLRAAILAFAAGSTSSDYQASSYFMNNMAHLFNQEQGK